MQECIECKSAPVWSAGRHHKCLPQLPVPAAPYGPVAGGVPLLTPCRCRMAGCLTVRV